MWDSKGCGVKDYKAKPLVRRSVHPRILQQSLWNKHHKFEKQTHTQERGKEILIQKHITNSTQKSL